MDLNNDNNNLPHDHVRHKSIIVTAPHSSVKSSSHYKHSHNSTFQIIESHFTQLSKIKNIPNNTSHRNKHGNFFLLIRWFLTATSGTKPIIVSAGNVYIQTNKQTNNNNLLEKDGGTKNCIYKA